MERISPTVRQRRLGLVLRALRAEDGRTAAEVAEVLGWTRTTLSRLEDAPRKPRVAQVGELLNVYGITGQRREDILQLVLQARQRGWWDPYRDAIPSEYDTYVGLEAEARSLRNFEPYNIPGLLQTAGHARALISARHPELSADEVEARVAVRVQRQQVVTGPDPVRLWTVLSEGALRRQVGGPEVAREQLAHLRKMADLPKVTIQVLPYDAGAAPAAGPFVIMTFKEPLDPEVVYVETPAGDIWVEQQVEVDRFLEGYERLIRAALPAKETRELLDMLSGI